MKTRRIALLALLALAALLAGACATLRVDVDVYTGPLADHEDIQAERLAVMAMGAKPLLIDLRDRLENEGRKAAWEKLNDEQRAAIDAAGNHHFGPNLVRYRAGHMTASADPGDHATWATLIDHKAQRVNGVLGLYEDSTDPRLREYLLLGHQLYDDYRHAHGTIGEGQKDDQAYWLELKKKLPLETSGDTATRLKLPGADGGQLNKAGLLLRTAYDAFFTPTRKEREAMGGLFSTAQAILASSKAPAGSFVATDPFPQETNAQYEALARPDQRFARSHARLLLQGRVGEEDIKRFADRITGRAQAYLDTRAALAALFRLSLDFIRAINMPPLSRQLASVPELTKHAAWLAVGILKCDDLEEVLKADEDLRGFQDKLFLAFAPANRITDSIARYDAKEQALLGLLRKEPRDTATALLAAHDYAIATNYQGKSESDRQFGITRFGANVPSLEKMAQAIQAITGLAAASGLEQGRGARGLESLIEDYIKASAEACGARCAGCASPGAAGASPECPDIMARLDAARDLLYDELARFGVKVQGTANFDVLMAPERGEGEGFDPDAPIPVGTGIEENIQVLQAVANSIVSQATELRFRQKHREDLAALHPGVISALGQTYLPVDGRTLARIQEQLRAEQSEAESGVARIEAEITAKKAKNEDTAGLEAEKKRLAGLIPCLRTADATVGAIREAWGPETNGSTPEVLARLRDKLATRSADRDQATSANANATRAVLDARTFDFAVMGPLSEQARNGGDPRLALDQLLDTLRLLLAQQVEAGGADSPAALHTREAISVVEAQRAGLVYLRPASAYLRSSYPATSVQPGYEPAWKNTLTRNFLRSIPIFGEVRSPNEKRRLKMFAEIDHLSWQTVNTVRLEGAGKTNYAIAKDDIGNWYAKAYSADPEPIIKAARNLAMYTLGAGTGSAAKALAAGAGNATLGQQKTALDQLREKYAARYEAQGKAQAESLIAWLKEQKDDTAAVQKAWTAAGINDFDDVLPAVKDMEDLPALGDTLKNNEQKLGDGARILAGLKAVKRYAVALNEAMLVRATQAQQQSQDTAEITRARSIARDVLRKVLATRLAQRQATVDEYATAVRFIEEASTGETTAAK